MRYLSDQLTVLVAFSVVLQPGIDDINTATYISDRLNKFLFANDDSSVNVRTMISQNLKFLNEPDSSSVFLPTASYYNGKFNKEFFRLLF